MQNNDKINHAYAILDRAYAAHTPSRTFAMFSGGYDSLVTAHVTATWAMDRGYPFSVGHINTGTGIEETRDYVIATCLHYGWELKEYKAIENQKADGTPDPQDYAALVREHGFPGPWMHRKMYSQLKERQIERMIRDHKQRAHDCIMLTSGKRIQESARRMRTTTQDFEKLGGTLWANPIRHWTKDDVLDYKELHSLPNNIVVDWLHRSGECNCGAFAQPGELADIELFFPKTGCWLRQLEREVRAAGFPWGWEDAPPEWWKKIPGMTPERWASMNRKEQLALLKGQTNMWDSLLGESPLCSSCDARFERTMELSDAT